MEKNYICSECGKSFYVENVLKSHVYLVHEVKKRDSTYECDKCGRRFKLKSLLKKHFSTHLEKAYQCTFCDKFFSTKWNKKVHEKQH